MSIEERKQYLDGDDIENPEDFIITPGVRNRLLKAIALNLTCIGVTPAMPMGITKLVPEKHPGQREIEPTIKTSLNFLFINGFLPNVSNEHVKDPELRKIVNFKTEVEYSSMLTSPEQSTPDVKVEESVQSNETSYSIENITKPRRNTIPKCNQRDFHFTNVEKYLKNLCTQNNTEVNCEAHKDFDLQFNFDIEDSSRSFGHYICFACNKKNVKFSFTKGQYIVLQTIRDHFKIHLSKSITNQPKPPLTRKRKNDCKNENKRKTRGDTTSKSKQ